MIKITVTPTPNPSRELVIQRVSCIDSPIAKTIEAQIQDVNTGQLAVVMLWSGNEYDAIGDWTDDQADTRLNELATEENVKTWFNLQ